MKLMMVKRNFFNLFKKKGNVVKFYVYPQGDKRNIHEVNGYAGDNLLDTINDQQIKDLSVFGICDKQLACHSCRINVISGYKQFPIITEDEQDVLCDLDHLYKNNSTRMSC